MVGKGEKLGYRKSRKTRFRTKSQSRTQSSASSCYANRCSSRASVSLTGALSRGEARHADRLHTRPSRSGIKLDPPDRTLGLNYDGDRNTFRWMGKNAGGLSPSQPRASRVRKRGPKFFSAARVAKMTGIFNSNSKSSDSP